MITLTQTKPVRRTFVSSEKIARRGVMASGIGCAICCAGCSVLSGPAKAICKLGCEKIGGCSC